MSSIFHAHPSGAGRKKQGHARNSHQSGCGGQSDQHTVAHDFVWNEGQLVEVAEEICLELSPVVRVAGHATCGGADVDPRASAVGGIKTVNRENPKDVQVLAIEGVEVIRFFNDSASQKRGGNFTGVNNVLGGASLALR